MNPAVIKAKTVKPLDRRARRTRQAIKESFAALAANRPLPDLTVKEVMERAGVNRATFYAHFSNIEDLERAMETDAAERVIERATRMRESEEHREGDLAVALVCLLDDRDACRWLLGPQSLGAGKTLLADHLERLYLQQILAADGMTELRARRLFDYAFEGAFGVLVRCQGQAVVSYLVKGTLFPRGPAGETSFSTAGLFVPTPARRPRNPVSLPPEHQHSYREIF